MIISAIPFTGNKRKIWGQIEPLLPEGKMFFDLFTGGGTVALNATDKYEAVFAYELAPQVAGLHKAMAEDPDFFDKVVRVDKHYKDTGDDYYRLRDDYNLEPTAVKLLILTLRSNSNYMRFSKKTGFNVPYGKRNHLNKDRLEKHIEVCKKVDTYSGSYEGALSLLNLLGAASVKNTVVYCDPPYSNTTAPYCEQGKWGDCDDEKLLDTLLGLHNHGFRVVISNVFHNRGKTNQRLINWCSKHADKFTVHHLNRNYNNSSFHKSTEVTDEVLIISK